MIKEGQIGVTTGNIFPIIKKFLYSDHEIFLREVISNAVDATQKLKTLSDVGEFKGEPGDLSVRISVAVSYTHLPCRETRSDCLKPVSPGLRGISLLPPFYSRPVSYTHLDVYKRQDQSVNSHGTSATHLFNNPVSHVWCPRLPHLEEIKTGTFQFSFSLKEISGICPDPCPCLLYTSRCV